MYVQIYIVYIYRWIHTYFDSEGWGKFHAKPVSFFVSFLGEKKII